LGLDAGGDPATLPQPGAGRDHKDRDQIVITIP
jgi:hypothetical protein